MRRFVLAVSSVAALGCLGACSDGKDAAGAVVASAPSASSSPAPLDPYAWTEVPYQDYLDAAEQIGLRPDVLKPEAGFSTGLDALCHTTPEEFAAMRKAQMANTRETDTYTTAQYLGEEVGLRIGLACPQRMGDWTATDDDHADDGNTSADDGSEVTDEDLARAEADEAGASSDPDRGTGTGSPAPTDRGTPSGSIGESTTSDAGGGAGNPAPQR